MNFLKKRVVCLCCGFVAGWPSWSGAAAQFLEVSERAPLAFLIRWVVYPTSVLNPYMRILDRNSYFDCLQLGRMNGPIENRTFLYELELTDENQQNFKFKILEDIFVCGSDREGLDSFISQSFKKAWDE